MTPLSLLVAATLTATLTPHIELYTMGEGPHIFERFGHAALCVVYDEAPPLSRCYNYGMMDFDTPPLELGWSFLRGTTLFWVEADRLEPMVQLYEQRDRSVWRQRLPLNPAQARALATALAENAREEHKFYVYHHFRDNCSTRLRDHLDRAFGGALSRNAAPTGNTYRSLGRLGLADVTSILVASDFLVGRGADKELNEYERMFLPRYLRQGVQDRLGVPPEVIYLRKGPPMPHEVQSGRGLVVGVSLGFALLLIAIGRRRPRMAQRMAALLLGGLGLVVWGVALASTIPELTYNEVLAVLVPFDLGLLFLDGRRMIRYVRLRIAGLLLVSILVATGVFIQPILTVILVPFLLLGALLVPTSPTSAASSPTPVDAPEPSNDPAPVRAKKRENAPTSPPAQEAGKKRPPQRTARRSRGKRRKRRR